MSGVAPLLPDDAHNRTLLSQVRPADWVNPEPAPQYDLVILGAGAAGWATASRAAAIGARVAIVERNLLGGARLNFGGVPAQTLLRAARAAAAVRDAGPFGVEIPQGTRVDFGTVMERMRRLRAALSPNHSPARLRHAGVDVFLGEGRFSSPQTVEVAGSTLRFRKALIATGSRPAAPPIPGLAAAGFLTRETIFSLTELPRRLAVVGAGPWGCELAQAFARFGAHVFLLEAATRILPREDPDAAERLQRALQRDGVAVLAGCKIDRVEKLSLGKGMLCRQQCAAQELLVDEILVGTGRAPNVVGLNLDAAGVAFDPRNGIAVNDRLQTSNRHIFAAGDVCTRLPLSHAADAMARIVTHNTLLLGRDTLSALTIPCCTYTSPEIAHVGLYESEATQRGIPTTTFTQEFSDVDRALLDGELDGFVRLHVRSDCDRIVGATVVAEHAGEIISELTLAMVGRLGLKTLAQVIHPYPTQAEAIHKIADAYQCSRPVPQVKRLWARWLNAMR
jgi:pyruvate/2-oxoglutarate dehydrogenase complex dihydrolipoamide dehydrogenase (E3) component